MVKRLEQMRNDFTGDLIRQFTPCAVHRKQSDTVGCDSPSVFVDSGNCENRIEIPRFPRIAVEPRAVAEPGIVYVVAERETVIGQFRDVGHPRDNFESGIEVQRRPRGVDRRCDSVFAVKFADGACVRRNLQTGGVVAAARFDNAFRIRIKEILPE